MGKEKETEPFRFTVAELKKAKVMRDRVDLLDAVTGGVGKYTIDEANEKIEKYLKGKVE